MFTKFINYNVSRELQGAFLATEQVRLDKLVDWIKREKPAFNTSMPVHTLDGFTPYDAANPTIPKSKQFWVGGLYRRCFEGYTPAECSKLLKEHRLPYETELEAYDRLRRIGIKNSPKFERASPEFVSQLLQSNPTLKQKQVNRQ